MSSLKIQRGRYKAIEEIFERIDSKLSKVQRYKEKNYAAELKAVALIAKRAKDGKPLSMGEKKYLDGIRNGIESREKAIAKITNFTLPYLKGKAAEFKTMILPGVQIDSSIQK